MQNEEKHDSFGMVGISHVTGKAYLNGSNFEHQHYVQLTIRQAYKKRDLSWEWWLGDKEIVNIYLSEAQLVELISRPNIGYGVPCTINHVMGTRMPPPPPPKPLTEEFHADMKADCSRCVADLEAASKELNDAIESGKIGKTVLREIAEKLRSAAAAVQSGIPFVERSFAEAMEREVRNAAAEIEATVTQTAIRLGIDEMRRIYTEAPKLIGGEVEKALANRRKEGENENYSK